jgi:uncharacterized protein
VSKSDHEIRDPIHVFVHLNSDERRVLDSRPFQRLRHIHQLGMTYLLYPGATHRRFEHSLGVMDLASRVFDVVTHPNRVHPDVKQQFEELRNPDGLRYWRQVLRMAALCHDIGHLPFSHAAEKELLPKEWNHERLTWELICDKEMHEIWARMTPPLRSDDVRKLAVGRKKAPDPDMDFSTWEDLLAEIIVGDAFGVDRMDYLLRDSHHLGVAYGKFDHYRLIETLKILRPAHSGDSGEEKEQSKEPRLGIEQGGLQSAEALSLARYFMYTQVYFHPVRRIYDIHLRDFLKAFLPKRGFSEDLAKHLALTDNEVNAAIWRRASDPSKKGHEHARRLVGHEHFKVLFRPSPGDLQTNPEAGRMVFEAAIERFGEGNLRYDRYYEEGSALDFPVLTEDGQIVSSTWISKVLEDLPLASVDYVFVERGLLRDAKRWLEENRDSLLEPREE